MPRRLKATSVSLLTINGLLIVNPVSWNVKLFGNATNQRPEHKANAKAEDDPWSQAVKCMLTSLRSGAGTWDQEASC